MTQKAAAQTTQAVKAPTPTPQLMLQRAAVSDAAVPDVPAIVQDVLRAPGRPLDAATRAYMEPRFGYDFSGVRVHTDDRAAESARAVNALAYTVGRDVVFGAGRYQPQGEEGRRLIAHELTHTLQQRGAADNGTPLEVARPEAASERSAEAAARSVAQGGAVQPQAPEPRRVARQAAPADAAKPKKIGKIVRIQINLTKSEVRFQTASGETLYGTVDTDLEAGAYTLIPDVAAKHWRIPGAKPGLRFDLELEEADPWKLNYPPRLALEVVSGSKEDVSLGKTLDAADAEQTQGDPQEMPGYIQNAVKSVNIPIWGGPFYLYDKPVAYGTTPAKVVMPRSEFALDDDPLKGGPVEIRLVYKSRALADAAVAALGVKNAYAFYVGASGLIYPTVLSDTAVPALCAALRTAVKNERADAKAASKLGVDLALWYVGARYPAKVTEGGPAKVAEAAPAAPKAGATLIAGFTKTESAVITEVRGMLSSSEMAEIRAARAAGKDALVKMGGRTIQYDPGYTYGEAMTWFEERGFTLGPKAFVSEEELTKTFLHETYRLTTSEIGAGAGATGAAATSETGNAFEFAERASKAVFQAAK